jgi:hypothetical protein
VYYIRVAISNVSALNEEKAHPIRTRANIVIAPFIHNRFVELGARVEITSGRARLVAVRTAERIKILATIIPCQNTALV